MSSEELTAAERLKFGDMGSSMVSIPGAHDGNDMDTTAAEILKYGSSREIENAGQDEGVARAASHGSDSYSQNYEDEEVGEEGIEMQRMDSDEENDSFRAMRRRERSERRQTKVGANKQKGADDFDDEEYGVIVEQIENDPYNIPNDENYHELSRERKAVDDGWRSLCILCSCMSCIVIMGLSIGLGRAAGKTSEEPPPAEVIIKTKKPTGRPSIAPTMPDEDFTWCYEGDESKALEFGRYASMRSGLIDSGLSTEGEFSNSASYQRKSLCWLAFGDRLQLDPADPFLDQRYSLAAIFHYFGEPEIGDPDSPKWLSGRPECQWTNVECDVRTDTTVTRLFLAGLELEGTLPKEMSVLEHVQYLDLSTNFLEGDIASVIGNWANLEELNLSANVFENLPSLDGWKSLRRLDISSNTVEGNIPPRLASSSQLVYLNLAENRLEGVIPEELGSMTSLQTLYMHHNGLVGSMPEAVCDLRAVDLKHLTVDCAPFRKEVECDGNCCTACSDYDLDSSPWDR